MAGFFSLFYVILLSSYIEVIALRKIIRNAIRCNHCGDVIESTFRHNYVQCSCGKVAVDGGTDYLRRSYSCNRDDYTDLSEYADVDELRKEDAHG